MKRNVLIVGGGISGLTAAFELSENIDLCITVVESTSKFGGKMRGHFDTKRGQFVEHSIRAISSTYFSLFDLFKRADVLDQLSPVDEYKFYEKSSGKSVVIDRTAPLSPMVMIDMMRSFNLSPRDMVHMVSRILHHVNASEEERAQMAHQKAGDAIGVENFDPLTKQFITNWFGILTGARMHSKAVDIMDSFLLMFLPMTESPNLPDGKVSKSYCFNRPTSHVIDSLVDLLKGRGVKLITDTRLTSIELDGDTVRVKTNPGLIDSASFDAAVMAVPHEVMLKLGLLNTESSLADEWSFGAQFPLDKLPEAMKPFVSKSYNLCFDAPWNIVFQIQHRDGFWTDVEFPDGTRYNLSATSSSPHNNGALYGKPMGECTPDEVLNEVLFQLGISDEEERAELAARAVVDPIFLEFTEDWKDAADLETVEFGPLHKDGRRWINRAQIYVRSALDPEIGPACGMKGVFLAGEVVTVPGRWKIPTMEQAATSGKQAAQLVFEHLRVPNAVSIETSQLEHKHAARAAELILNSLSKLM